MTERSQRKDSLVPDPTSAERAVNKHHCGHSLSVRVPTVLHNGAAHKAATCFLDPRIGAGERRSWRCTEIAERVHSYQPLNVP